MYRILSASVLCILLSVIVEAQTIREFTHEKQAFYDEIYGIMRDADKQETKAFMDDVFGPFWLNSTIYDDVKAEKIYTVADGILKKRLRPYPYYKSFLTCLMSFPGSPQEGEGFDIWIQTLMALMNESKSDLEEYITMSELLFKSNTFYQSPSTTWKSDNAGWQFAFDGEDPSIVFPNLNLICRAKGDSSVIYSTSGTYYPERERFEGTAGKVTWERAALDPNETYAIIEHPYEIRTRSSSFKIDSVKFFNPFFSYPLLGVVEDKILANVTSDEATYPQFSSYQKRLSITNLFDKVDYNGGFRMEGANIKGYGSKTEPARLIFKRGNLPQVITYSQFYTIEPDRISTTNARLVILLNNDSIVHPSLTMRYRNADRSLTLIRTNEGLSKSPFYDSYHKVDMYFETLTWNIDDPIMRMGNLVGSTETRAAFESTNFFKYKRYYSLQGLDRINPLYAIRQYARKIDSDYFYGEALANDLGFSLEAYIPRLIDLTNKGFIDYDLGTQKVQVRQKLYDYISAAAGNIDYDVIVFNSNVENGDNAKLNLVNFDLSIRGVDRILLSDSQNVAIYPKNGEINLRKNRDFNFGGVIRSGRFEFFGQEYAFDYDKFQIDLIHVDSCRLYVEDFSPNSKRLRRVKNVIEGIAGTLQIDNPYNKSGLQEQFTQFPILTSSKSSFVYYDSKSIQDGVYKRDKVFFELEPFVLDSLDNFATEQVAFNGRFVSGGILPELSEVLQIQDDYSLGFERTTPPEGIALYGDKARFKNDIVLNSQGLQGNGEIEYLTATAASEQFTFFPDSTRGITSSFVNRPQKTPIEIPEAHATTVDLGFYPIDDRLTAGVIKTPISMFEGQAEAKVGKIDLRPAGLTGSGVIEFNDAELEAKLINYKHNTFSSDTAAFRLIALQEANLAFKTDNVNAFIDFNERIGKFKSNGDETKVEFPVNDYICYMDQFKWFMDENDIALETSKEMATDFVIDTELDMTRSNFFSVAKGQDSLNFMSPNAVYDLDSYTITATNIPWIRVADAKITPDSGKVVIRKRAKMDPLEHATILANFVTKYYTINDASVTILSRFDYVGSGEYTYVDLNQKENVILIETLGVDSSLQTVGTGHISVEDNFFLSPHFAYQGRVELRANDKFLTFDGSTRIIHNCDRLERNWMKFTAEIDPNNVEIPVDTIVIDNRGGLIEVGLMLAQEPYEIYGTFLSASREDADQPILTSRGILKFNTARQTYEVAAADKLKQNNLPGNFVSLKPTSCELNAEGNLKMARDLGQFELKTIGHLTFNSTNEKVEIDAAMTIDFPFNQQALENMREYLNAVPDLKPVDFSKSNYEYAIRELMGLKASDKVISELSLSGTLKKIPDALNKTFFISDVNMTWDPVLEAFVSQGDIGIASIGEEQFFRKIPGKLVIEKRKSGDIFHLYLEVDDAHWYYFTYKRGLLQVYTSDKEFNNMILEEKADKRKTPGKKKEDDYLYMLGSETKQNIFLDQFMF